LHSIRISTIAKRNPIVQEFYRMCDFFEWERDDYEKKTAHEEFKTAIVLTFNALYGTDVEDIDSWHKLCVALDINPLPKRLKNCRRVSTPPCDACRS
jgi:hypothetical protein